MCIQCEVVLHINLVCDPLPVLMTLFALHIYVYRRSGIKCALNYVCNFMPSFTYHSVLVVVYSLVLKF